MSARDHLSPTQFWRAHPNDRPFSAKDATSKEWGTSNAPDKGYSSFEKPEQLFGYFNPGERDDHGGDNHPVSFTGKRVGTGMESEPLVIPDMKHVKHHTWDDLTSQVGEDVVADINRRNGWDHDAYQ